MVFEDCVSIAFWKAVIELNDVVHLPIDIVIVQDVGMFQAQYEVLSLDDPVGEYLCDAVLLPLNERLLENVLFGVQVLLVSLEFPLPECHQRFVAELSTIQWEGLKQPSLDL